ncbi:MAG: GIY-YIG nuclease family protein [Cylindrospermopsis raciborskii KL1]|jgi:predicted GIY-YIG superfamily endonuclease|uniref:GIY-YIG nuclease family protein n=1 Tax=Cylindrospermopsis raciborskii TaxID=77022 RepID=UPI001A276231|nr:GIY-YIG nuclease family protein [Cylindrospermopsis raciborskii]MBG0744705.1 GIY-YIG nuclease family protein [Cylindrospermopsis raciborskii KL1]
MLEKLTQIKKLAYTPFVAFNSLPEHPGIYFVTDGASRVWYCGIADNLKQRHLAHEKKNLFLEAKCHGLRYFLWEDRQDLEEWEEEAIKHYQPPLNKEQGHHIPLVDLGYEKSSYFNRYLEIRMIQKELEKEMEELKPNIVSLLEEQGEKVRTDSFYAYLIHRKKYEYSQEVKDLELRVKMQRRKEEDEGIAIVVDEIIFPSIKLI